MSEPIRHLLKKWRNLFRAASTSLLKNRMRSLLTALGIIIGVGAVIVMVSIGQGVRANIQGEISSMGANLITVSPVRTRTGGVSRETIRNTLVPEDVEALREQVPELEAVSAVTQVRQQVVGPGGNWSTTVYGADRAYFGIRNWTLAAGRSFTDDEVRARAKVAVIGQTVINQLFPGRNPIGQQIRIGTVPFTVVGTLEAKGSSFGGDQDDVVIAPWSTVLYRLSGDRFLQSINVSARNEDGMAVAEARVRSVLRTQHGLHPGQADDFEIRNQADILETASAITQTLTLFLGAIASISLLVGGIGIMNIMLVSVTERTREIGIRKSIGARRKDIMRQFLLEAFFLCQVGGLFGILLGVLVGNGVAVYFDISGTFPWGWAIAAVAMVSVISLVFGGYPAYKAARLDPIDALRYE